MILLQASHISKSYGATPILSDVTLTVQSGERVGLVGVNGAGKSTLLKIISGKISCDTGEIFKPKEATVGYLAQDGGLESSNSVYQELLTVFQPLVDMEKQLRKIELEIGDPDIIADIKRYQQLLDNYDLLSETFKAKGGYSYQALLRSIMHGLNLDALGSDTPIENLSRGQKTLVALAKLLLSAPDVLMLDEPTNYLDINTLNWLEQYLKGYSGAILVVSHDRYLLDTLVNVIYELNGTKAIRYQGNYSKYLVLKAEQLELQQKIHDRQMDEVARMKDFIQRNIARASTTKRAQSRRRMLEKIEIIDNPEYNKKAFFRFSIKRQSGKEVLKARDLTIGHSNLPLSSHIDFLLEREDSIALVGPNGVGKSTLLKTLIGSLKQISGDITYGTNVQVGYYEQEQANLRGSKQVLHQLWDEYPHMDEKDIRTVLGNFLFTGDDVLKTLDDLSGGEKARLALASLMLQQANLLILDEPTNHLDIYSREVLENALVDFPGTILFVSHDRYFVNRIATGILELNTEGVKSYLGDYDYYIAKKQQLTEDTTASTPVDVENKQQDKQKYLESKEIQRVERKRQRRITELEALIHHCESQITELEHQLTQPKVYQDYEKCLEINNTLEKLKVNLEEHMLEWMELEG